MKTEIVTSMSNSLLPAIRTTLRDADEAFLCVAFISEKGVYLLHKELKYLSVNAKVLATTVFGNTSGNAVQVLQGFGNQVGVLNPSGGTYHPKMYISKHRDGAIKAVIGSSNLTGGLISNIEIASVLSGTVEDKPLAECWELGKKLWAQKNEIPIVEDISVRPIIEPKLYRLIEEAVAKDPIFWTLGSKPKANRITKITPYGLYVETESSIRKGTPPQLVDATMISLAWDYLRTHKHLSNTFLLNVLRVHRSSAVCAIFARLPMVTSRPGRSITLELI